MRVESGQRKRKKPVALAQLSIRHSLWRPLVRLTLRKKADETLFGDVRPLSVRRQLTQALVRQNLMPALLESIGRGRELPSGVARALGCSALREALSLVPGVLGSGVAWFQTVPLVWFLSGVSVGRTPCLVAWAVRDAASFEVARLG